MALTAAAYHRLSRYRVELAPTVRATVGKGKISAIFGSQEKNGLVESLALEIDGSSLRDGFGHLAELHSRFVPPKAP